MLYGYINKQSLQGRTELVAKVANWFYLAQGYSCMRSHPLCICCQPNLDFDTDDSELAVSS